MKKGFNVGKECDYCGKIITEKDPTWREGYRNKYLFGLFKRDIWTKKCCSQECYIKNKGKKEESEK